MLALQALAMDMKRSGQAFSKYQIKRYGGREYVIFEGYPSLRRHLKRSRYWANHPKVVSFGIGRSGMANLAKGGFVVSILVSAGFHLLDQLFDDKKTWRHFVAGMAVDIAVVAAASGIAWGTVSMVMGATSMVAIGPLLAVVAVGAILTYTIDGNFNSEAIVESIAEALEILEEAMGNQAAQVGRGIGRVEREYQSDPVSFMHRLFSIPQTPRFGSGVR